MNDSQQKRNVAGLFDRAAPTYGTGIDFFAEVGRGLVAHAAPRAGERVLDVGCGRGAALFPAAQAVGPTGRVVGIDLAPGMVKLAAEKAGTLGLETVEVRLGDAEAPDFPLSSFDLVLGSLVMFFLPDLPGTLRRYADILKPGGRLAVSTFVANDRQRWLPVEQAFLGYLPAPSGPPAQPHTDPRAWSDRLLTHLAATGYTGIECTEHRYDTEFPTPEHWWSWMESMGYRATIEAIPADRVGEARRAVFDAIDGIRDASGRIVWSAVMRFTKAVRPELPVPSS